MTFAPLAVGGELEVRGTGTVNIEVVIRAETADSEPAGVLVLEGGD